MEPGTGKMFVKKDGTVLSFDTNKCYKNMIELGRVPRTTAWTRAAKREKEIALAAAAPKEAAPAEVPAKAVAKKSKKVPVKKEAPKEVPAEAPAENKE